MKYFTVAMYVTFSDILQGMHHKEDSQRRINDATIMTTLVIACRYFGGNIDKALSYMKSDHCHGMLSKSQFNRRMHRIKDLIIEVFGIISSVFKQENERQYYLLDSFPVRVCHNIRISRCKLLEGECFRGKSASKREYFYGFKVAVLCTEEGAPVEVAFLPGAYHDSQFLNRMYMDLPPQSAVFGDNAFENHDLEDNSDQMDQIQWEVMRKKNTTRGDIYQIRLWKKQIRRKIESVFSAISALLPKSIHAVTADGFNLKTFMFIFAYALSFLFVEAEAM
jgi:Transposase DDE domain